MNQVKSKVYQASEMMFYLKPPNRALSSLPNKGKLENNKLPIKNKEVKTPLPFSRDNKVKLAKELIALILTTCRCVFMAVKFYPAKARNVIKELKEKKLVDLVKPRVSTEVNKQLTTKITPESIDLIETIKEKREVENEQPQSEAVVGSDKSSSAEPNTTIAENMKADSDGKTDQPSITKTKSECNENNLLTSLTNTSGTGLLEESICGSNNVSGSDSKSERNESPDIKKKQRVLLPRSFFTMIFKRRPDTHKKHPDNATNLSSHEDSVDAQNDIKITIVKPSMIQFKETDTNAKSEQPKLENMYTNKLDEGKIGNIVRDLPDTETDLYKQRIRFSAKNNLNYTLAKPHITELKVELLPKSGTNCKSNDNTELRLTKVDKKNVNENMDGTTVQHKIRESVHMRPTLTNMYLAELNKEKRRARVANRSGGKPSCLRHQTSDDTQQNNLTMTHITELDKEVTKDVPLGYYSENKESQIEHQELKESSEFRKQILASGKNADVTPRNNS